MFRMTVNYSIPINISTNQLIPNIPTCLPAGRFLIPELIN
jgi:hypothetical protein